MEGMSAQRYADAITYHCGALSQRCINSKMDTVFGVKYDGGGE